MSWIAAGSTAAGLLGGMGGGSGSGAPVSSGTAPTNVVFGSVNFKSPGAGDSAKVAGASDPATQAAFATAGSVPWWAWALAAVGVVVLILSLIKPRKKN